MVKAADGVPGRLVRRPSQGAREPGERPVDLIIHAGRGLTNGEIADRLLLSPRTVASHLHRSYSKLGIAGRHQLRDLIDHAGTSQVSA